MTIKTRLSCRWPVATAIAFLFALAACGGSSGPSSPSAPAPTPAPTPTPVVYDGSWEGLTSESEAAKFVVQNNTITSFTLGQKFGAGGFSCTVTVTLTNLGVAIANGRFTLPIQASGLSTSVSGTFSSASAMSGTYEQVNMTNVSCGRVTINGFKAGGTFNATK